MTEKKIITSLKIFIILTSFHFLIGNLISFAFFSFFMLAFVYFTKDSTQDKKEVLYFKWIKWSAVFLFFIWILQLIPFPGFLINKLSSISSKLINLVSNGTPDFHTISVIPYETFFFGIEIMVLVLFSFRLLSMKFEKKELISIIETIVLSLLIKILLISGLFIFYRLKIIHNFDQMFFHELRSSVLIILPMVLGIIFYQMHFLYV